MLFKHFVDDRFDVDAVLVRSGDGRLQAFPINQTPSHLMQQHQQKMISYVTAKTHKKILLLFELRVFKSLSYKMQKCDNVDCLMAFDLYNDLHDVAMLHLHDIACMH